MLGGETNTGREALCREAMALVQRYCGGPGKERGLRRLGGDWVVGANRGEVPNVRRQKNMDGIVRLTWSDLKNLQSKVLRLQVDATQPKRRCD